jgi:hypothetical protein
MTMLPMILAALAQSAPQLIQGLFGNSGDPSRNAGREYFNYYNQSKNALGDYKNDLNTMKDPSGFINKLMGGYQESPWARNLEQRTNNAATNMASANGLSGSTPLMMQMQQNSHNIASQDQDKWLQHVLGINTDYMNGSQHYADQLSALNTNQGANAANASYGQTLGQNYDQNQLMQGIAQFLLGNGQQPYSGGPQFPAYMNK